MKRKEREHLKEDPLAHFIEKFYHGFQNNKKQIYSIAGGIVAAVVIIALIIIIRNSSLTSQNKYLNELVTIKNSPTLTLDQKIGKVNDLAAKFGNKPGLLLTQAALYFQKGDFEKTQGILSSISSGDRLINGEKKLIEAEILLAQTKKKEAIDLLYALYSDTSSLIPKDFLLIKIAKIQKDNGQQGEAIVNLRKLTKEFEGSYYSMEAQGLLSELEGPGANSPNF